MHWPNAKVKKAAVRMALSIMVVECWNVSWVEAVVDELDEEVSGYGIGGEGGRAYIARDGGRHCSM